LASTPQIDRKAVGQQDRLAAAVAGGGEQLERATAVGLEALAMAARWSMGRQASRYGKDQPILAQRLLLGENY